jgi:hypothetical protein
MYIDLIEYIESLKSKLGPNSKTYQSAMQAFVDYPGLKAFTDDGVVRLCDLSSNYYVNKIDVNPGKHYFARLFLESKGTAIYSDPPVFIVGTPNAEGFGVTPYKDWEENMLSEGINPDAVKEIKKSLSFNAAVNYTAEA